MVNRNFNYNHKNVRTHARDLLIECGLCWYGGHKYSGYGVLNDALSALVWPKIYGRMYYDDIKKLSKEQKKLRLIFSSSNYEY